MILMKNIEVSRAEKEADLNLLFMLIYLTSISIYCNTPGIHKTNGGFCFVFNCGVSLNPSSLLSEAWEMLEEWFLEMNYSSIFNYLELIFAGFPEVR